MSEPFLGQIVMFAGNFAPRGWAFCDGQLLPINQHQALFSILGTTYGGDGRTTFALPDLRGCVPVHPGSGQDATGFALGQKGGHETVNLKKSALPRSANVDVALAGRRDEPFRLDLEHDNMQPYQCVNFIIAIEGIFPART
jgi:microcystin-dependent protein